jgi:uncharacterized protein (DUF362 family)
MANGIRRRSLFQLAGAAALLRGRMAAAQQPQAPAQFQAAPPRGANRFGNEGHPETFPESEQRSTVSIIQGDQRRKNAYDALKAIDRELRAKMQGKKYVVIKPNFVNSVNQLAATHVDAMRGILDYLAETFNGPVVVAEAAAGDTREAYDNFHFAPLVNEYAKQQVKLIDLNDEAKFVRIALLDGDLHIFPCRIAARLVDPDAFIISSAKLKTHNTVIASLSIKNLVLGAPLHQAHGETPRWNEKRKYHVGLRQTHYNMLVTAQHLNWGASLIDGFEGMEGNGPNSGTPVASHIALASVDCVAADRIAADTMGINPEWMGYVKYCGQLGLGQFDANKIDVIGAKVADVKKTYRLHTDIERELEWKGPMTELPFNLGWVQPICPRAQEG